MERLPDAIAQVIMAEAYNSDWDYHLITDTEGSYVTAYDRATGERMNVGNSSDGIPDDMELDVEEFRLLEDEIEAYENERDYSKFRWIMVPIVLSSLVLCASVIWFCGRMF